jgi:hypothetical protein
MAYIIGLITTDGNLSKDGRHMNFTSKDIQLVRLFKKSLNLKVVIGKKSSGSVKEMKYFQVQFGDVLFYRWLITIGLKPNKSKILSTLNIPDKYFFDFLRGCFDGDGSMYSYWDPRWHSSYMFYLQFISSSPRFIMWLQNTITRLSGVRGRIQEANRSQHLIFAKKDTKIVFDKMFYKKRLPCLRRKLLKARKIFREDKIHNKRPDGGIGIRDRLRTYAH